MHARELEKRICVERRIENSRRLHFNRLGDWRPRLIIWPEDNGWSKDEFPQVFDEAIDSATEEQWGQIVAGTIERFADELQLHVTAFDRVLPAVWQRLTSRYATHCWKRSDLISPDASYVNIRPNYWHCDPVFLATPTDSLVSVPEMIQAPLLDRTNLLPFGTAIFDFGIEEAVMEIAFAEHEDVFLSILDRVANDLNHQIVHTDKHFVSHWKIANPTSHGADCREF